MQIDLLLGRYPLKEKPSRSNSQQDIYVSFNQKFQEIHAYIKNQSDYNIKNLRSDGGGEFTSNEFEVYLKSHGITIPLFLFHGSSFDLKMSSSFWI